MADKTPQRLAELFIEHRKGEKAPSTVYNNRGHVNAFADWCQREGIESVRDIDGETLLEYKFALKNDPDKNDTTIGNHFSTLREFFRFCNLLDATNPEQDLVTKLKSFEFSKSGQARETMLDVEEVKAVLDYLKKYEYATVKHVAFLIMWHTGCRVGALAGLDLKDYSPVKQREHGVYGLLSFNHRPETGTGLKNDEGGEREVMIMPRYGEVIEDYIEINRRDLTDDYGRKPLLTSPNGRYHRNTFQAMVYGVTRPCVYANKCPHGRDKESCEAGLYEKAAKCPSSVSPHPMRRTAITYHLEEMNWTYEGASGRFDVSVDTLKAHYDQSSKEGRRKTRAAMFYDGDQGVL